jgi:predicted TIM-barrel fold metal-dependent hydrolase
MIGRRGAAAGALALAAALPAHAAEPAWIDAHAHVFVRGLKSPFDARYVPNYDASWETLLETAEHNGIGRAVLQQPYFLGFDNSYLMSALRAKPDRFRGVPWISPSTEVSADQWDEMERLGVRGLRFPIWGLPTPHWPAYADMLGQALKRGWPLHFQVESRRLPAILPTLLEGGHRVVIANFGLFDRTLGPWRDPGFELLLEKASTGRLWVAMSGAYRVGPERARAAAPVLLDAFGADRLLWASDWPHMDANVDRAATYRDALKAFEEWIPGPATRERILVETPKTLYGF